MPTDNVNLPPSASTDGIVKMQQTLQDGFTAVAIDRPRLIVMPTETPRTPPTTAAGQTMKVKADETAVHRPEPNLRLMTQFTGQTPAASISSQRKDMEAHPVTNLDQPQSYLTLRLRVIDNQLHVVAAKEVPGPLAQPGMLVGEQAYEVVLDGQRLAIGDVADFGERRSYPRPGEHEHHVTEIAMPEFTVRIPRTALAAGVLDRLKINLYRFANATPKPVAERVLLGQQLGSQAKLALSLDGLKLARVQPQAREHLKAIFPSVNLK
jgi:hypothetical protein